MAAKEEMVYRISWKNRLARAVLRPLFRGVFRLLFRVTIVGMENIPQEGSYLITPNHVSLYDPPLVLAFWPVAPEVAGAAAVWRRPGQALLAKLYGGLRIHREEYDRQVLRDIRAVLQAGRPLLIAPEGTRSHAPGLQRAKPGVAYLAEKTKVPIVPVGVVGTTDDVLLRALKGKRPHLELRIGRPFTLPPIRGKGAERRAARQRNADLVMIEIARLLPEEYRGEYRHAIA